MTKKTKIEIPQKARLTITSVVNNYSALRERVLNKGTFHVGDAVVVNKLFDALGEELSELFKQIRIDNGI